MLRNLLAEMARHDVTRGDLAKTLKCSNVTICKKINGTSEFDYSQMKKIRDVFFSNLEFEYLFNPFDANTTKTR